MVVLCQDQDDLWCQQKGKCGHQLVSRFQERKTVTLSRGVGSLKPHFPSIITLRLGPSLFFGNSLFLFKMIHLLGGGMPQHVCGPQRTTSGNQSFLSTELARVHSFFPWMWVPEIGLKWACLAAGTFTCWAISPGPRNNRIFVSSSDHRLDCNGEKQKSLRDLWGPGLINYGPSTLYMEQYASIKSGRKLYAP